MENYEHHHEHEHEHHHDHHGFQSEEEALAVLKYMTEHNVHHTEELHDIAHKLQDSGKAEAAELIHEAFAIYTEGNEKLRAALKLLTKEE